MILQIPPLHTLPRPLSVNFVSTLILAFPPVTLSFLHFLPLSARLTSSPCCSSPIAAPLRCDEVTVGVTASLELHYMAAGTGGGGERSHKAGPAGWANPGRPGSRFTVGPLGEKAHLGRRCQRESRGSAFTKRAGADSSHSAREVTPRRVLMHKHTVCHRYYSKFRLQ